MITLNLLPESYKIEYAFERKRRLIIFTIVVLCAIVLVFNTLLFSTYLYIRVWNSSAVGELEKQKSEESVKRIDEMESNVKNTNAVIETLVLVKKDITVAGPALEQMALLIKPGVYLKSIALNASDGVVNLTGFSKSRELVLDLETALNHSDFVVPGSVRSPITNIFTSKNIDFSFTFKVKNHQ